MKIKIENDLFDISSRIKRINDRYEIYFDTDLQKFVIYAFGKLQLTVPYDELDERTLRYVWDTRAENAEKILEEIDKYNLSKEEEDRKKRRDEVENEVSRRLRLSRI